MRLLVDRDHAGIDKYGIGGQLIDWMAVEAVLRAQGEIGGTY